MMINKRLIGTVRESKKYIAANVALQWLGLIANILMIFSIAGLLEKLYIRSLTTGAVLFTVFTFALSLILRFICATGASRMSFLASRSVKKVLREKIYQKLLRLSASYHEKVSTSEIVQVSVEGVEQLETYFGSYLPQFFYSMLAPVTLFLFLVFISPVAAVVLLICVPLIPVAIAAVQTFAKKLLSRYWGQYTALGDTFLENLQGLTTLKIYQADEYKNDVMNEEAEKFRKITMKVLTMQLNSISIMDLVAYGGAALGIGIAAMQYQNGRISLSGAITILLLSADFFLPMRQLGSFFHIAMNGMAASDKIFRLLDLDEPPAKSQWIDVQNGCGIMCENLSFSYNSDREILHSVHMEFPPGSFTAIVGESGCGKSTLSAILTGRNKGYTGSVTVGNLELSDICEESLMKNITYVSYNSYLFKGTVRENLLMGCPDASDARMWEVLEKVKLAGFFRQQEGLNTPLTEKASNLSGGQCQRLSLARAILHDSPVYIFDEATSNIDVESETAIMEQIYDLAKTKTVLLISHRLANVTGADRIYVLEHGNVCESGTHRQLLSDAGGTYSALWNVQQQLENYGMEGICQ